MRLIVPLRLLLLYSRTDCNKFNCVVHLYYMYIVHVYVHVYNVQQCSCKLELRHGARRALT